MTYFVRLGLPDEKGKEWGNVLDGSICYRSVGHPRVS